MNITINRTEQANEVPYGLLLLADENPAFIDAYLLQSQWYLLRADGQVRGVCLLTTEGSTGEIVNLAIEPDFQGKGLGKRLLHYVIEAARQQLVAYVFIKTANSSIHQIKLYQQVGFDLVSIHRNYFLEAYPTPIWENGIQAKHQLVFQLTFT